jgi:hypothetical protein
MPPGKLAALTDLLLVRTSPSARLAAGGPGHLYLVEDAGALQLRVVLTADGGGTWSSLASPDPISHFIQGALAATGPRALFGALEFGPGPELRPPFPVRLWRVPARAEGPIPSSILEGATSGDLVSLNGDPGTYALYLEPGSTNVWVAQARAGNQVSVTSSQDDAVSFARPSVVDVHGPPARYVFGNGRIFVLDRGGVTVIALTPMVSRLASVAWPQAVATIQTAVVDGAGDLTAFATDAAGNLSAFRLDHRGGTSPSTERLGSVDGAVVAAARSDASISYVFSRAGDLLLATLPHI